jgi:glutamine amidotransferase PdxT
LIDIVVRRNAFGRQVASFGDRSGGGIPATRRRLHPALDRVGGDGVPGAGEHGGHAVAAQRDRW